MATSADILSHEEWTRPSCPGRKCDPAGPSPWSPTQSGGCSAGNLWSMDLFRNELAQLPAPLPPEDDMTDDQARQLAELHSALVAAYPGPINDPYGTPLNAAWAIAYAYQQVGELHSAVVTGQPGFSDPFGTEPLNPPWASLWGYAYIKDTLVPQLSEVLARLAAIETQLDTS